MLYNMIPPIRRAAVLAVLAFSATACARSGHEVETTSILSEEQEISSEADNKAALSPLGDDAFSIFDLGGEWRNEHARPVKIEDVSEKATVVALIYTSCTTTCPLIISALKVIDASVQKHPDVRFVLVSIDPDRDTPGRLAEWAQNTRLDESRWSLLSGSDRTVRELAVSLDVRYQQQSDGEISHTNGFSVIDSRGFVRHRQAGYSDVDSAVRVIRALLD